jgi:hypothetical protein
LERGLFVLGKLGKKKEEEILKERGREGGNWKNKIVLGNFYRGTVVAGNFGLGGQETARIPGARELERLFLVGWEVNIQFWAVWERTRKSEKGAKSTNLQVEVCILMLLLLLLLLLLCCLSTSLFLV